MMQIIILIVVTTTPMLFVERIVGARPETTQTLLVHQLIIINVPKFLSVTPGEISSAWRRARV